MDRRNHPVDAPAGMAADLAGHPTVDPAHYAVAVAAGSAPLPTSVTVACRIRKRLFV